MNSFQRNKLDLIFLLLFLFLPELILKLDYSNCFIKIDDIDVALIVNFNNLTKNKHSFFYDIIKKLNLKRNYYFIKSIGKYLNPNLNEIIYKSNVKLVQSNFPDSIFLPLVVSLYGNTLPDLIIFIEGEEILANSGNNLIKWIKKVYKKIIFDNYDYIFGNYQIINKKKLGCSLFVSKASIIEHLLYYTDSDTTHANPFIQLSYSTKAKFCFVDFNYTKPSMFDKLNEKFSVDMNCPNFKDNEKPSLCILLIIFILNQLFLEA